MEYDRTFSVDKIFSRPQTYSVSTSRLTLLNLSKSFIVASRNVVMIQDYDPLLFLLIQIPKLWRVSSQRKNGGVSQFFESSVLLETHDVIRGKKMMFRDRTQCLLQA